MESLTTYFVLGEIYNKNKSTLATLMAKVNTQNAEPIVCTLLPHSVADFDKFIKEDNGINYLQFRTQQSGLYESIWIPRLNIKSQKFPIGEIVGEAELFISGRWTQYESATSSITVNLFMPFTPLFCSSRQLSEAFINRTSVKQDLQDGDISWNMPSGEFVELLNDYQEQFTTQPSLTLTRRQQCSLKIVVDRANYNSFETFIYHIWQDYDEVMWLLSLLTKNYMFWDKAFLSWESGESYYYANVYRPSDLKLSLESGSRKLQTFDLLAKSQALDNGGFANMVSAYFSSPHQQLILRAIQFLLITYHTQIYVESMFGIVYSVWEMLVDGLTDEEASYTLDTPTFNSLSKALKKVIKSEFSGEKNKNLRKSIYEKLGELRRPTFQRRLVSILRKQKIDPNKFWPLGTDSETVDARLRDMINRRNEYVHQGRINDIQKSITDFHRIRLMVEMIIFSLLEYPLDQINVSAIDIDLAVGSELPDDYSFTLT